VAAHSLFAAIRIPNPPISCHSWSSRLHKVDTWLREGFVEQYRKEAQGFMGQAIAIAKNGLPLHPKPFNHV
jgi:hypothetical protein